MGTINLPGQPFTTPWVDKDTGLVSHPWQKFLESQQNFLVTQFGALAIRTVTTSVALNVNDIVVLANGAITITLPNPVTLFEIDPVHTGSGPNLSKTFYIRNISTANAVTVTPSVGQINGLTSLIMQPRVSHLIVTDGTNWYTLMANPTRVVTFAASGTWTWQGETAVRVIVVGGGGGGGGAGSGATAGGGGGGAGGEVVERVVIVSADVTVTVGAGGASGAGGAPGDGVGGTIGDSSSFGALLSARGGNFGQGGVAAGAGGPAGAAFTPDSTFGVNAAGGAGGSNAGTNGATPSRVAGLGASGAGGTGSGGTFGGGGGGGGSQGAGSNGGDGGTNNGATASANTGGGAGGGGAGLAAGGNGGAGGSGLIIVISEGS